MYKLLIVDDLRLDRESAAQIVQWEDLGIKLEGFFENGKDALEYLKYNPIDLVLADIEMPVMDGISLAREVKNLGIPVVIAFMSYYNEVDYLRSAIDLGAVSYMVKPVDKVCTEKLFTELVQRLNEENRMKKIVEESRQLLTNQLIHRLCSGLYKSESEAKDIVQLLDKTDWCSRFFLPIIIGISNAYNAEQVINQLSKFHAINEICMEFDIVLFGQSDEFRSVILVDGESKRDVITKANAIISRLENLLKESDDIVSGEACEGLLNIPQTYFSACELLRKKLLDTVNTPGFDENSIDAKFYPSQMLERLRFHLVNVDKINMNLFIGEIISGLKKMKDPSMIICTLNTVVVSVNAVLCEVGLTIDSINREHETLWWNDLTYAKCFTEIESWLTDLFQTVASILQIVKGSALSTIVSDVLLYMDENIAEEITVNKISETLYFSPNYLNQIFKQKTGKTIREYLQYLRIEKTKELLLKPGIPLNEVMRMVGYHKASYFSKMFKEATGMTPRQFRGLK